MSAELTGGASTEMLPSGVQVMTLESGLSEEILTPGLLEYFKNIRSGEADVAMSLGMGESGEQEDSQYTEEDQESLYNRIEMLAEMAAKTDGTYIPLEMEVEWMAAGFQDM